MPKKDRDRGAIEFIKKEHGEVKQLLDEFEKTRSSTRRVMVVRDALAALRVHIAIDEELLYPVARNAFDNETEMMNVVDEELHVAKILLAELETMSGDEDNWAAKFVVLVDAIRRHIKAEGKILKKIRKTEIDLEVLGARISDLKGRLTSGGMPPSFETEMIRKCGLRGDSPAKSLANDIQVPWKTEEPAEKRKQLGGEVQRRWEKLTDDDMTDIGGSHSQLVRRIRERYGISRQDAQLQVDEWRRSQKAVA